jgi:hypothetical protein
MKRTVMKSRTARRDVAGDGAGRGIRCTPALADLEYSCGGPEHPPGKASPACIHTHVNNDAVSRLLSAHAHAHASARPTSAFFSAGNFVQYGLEMLAGGLAAANAREGASEATGGPVQRTFLPDLHCTETREAYNESKKIAITRSQSTEIAGSR